MCSAGKFGPIVFVSDEEGSLEKGIELVNLESFKLMGIPITSLEIEVAKKIAKEEADKCVKNLKDKGFPVNIQKLLTAKTKKDAEKIASQIIIQGDDLACAIMNCDQIGFKHSKKHKWFHPESTIHTQQEKDAFLKTSVGPIIHEDAKKFIRKLKSQIKERKHISAHLFEKGEEWHILYFDLEDRTSPQGRNHWKLGNHIHYISYLWGTKFNKETLWKEFDNRKTKINSIHIKSGH